MIKISKLKMSLTNEQAKSIKEQLLKQANSLPEEQKEQIKSYITSMNNEQLEEFLKKNQMTAQKGAAKGNGCIFCSVANKQIEAFAIYEDKDYLAVLEIKPFSRGHAILIPKKHVKDTKSLKAKAFSIANKIGKHLVKRMDAESFQINTAAEMNHAIIDIIPIYKGVPLNYERKPIEKKSLQELAIKIGLVETRKKMKEKSAVKQAKCLKEAIIKLQRRIP